MASRPAQGDNLNRKYPTQSAAYARDLTPKVVSTGTSSNPTKRARSPLAKSNVDATPKVVES